MNTKNYPITAVGKTWLGALYGLRQGTRCGLWPIVFLLVPLAGIADQLKDPTRPPTSLSTPQGGPEMVVPSGPQLQSVRISAHQSSAIISGQRVNVGDHFGDAKVISITENEVLLKGGSGVQTLKLFPGVGKLSIFPSQHPRHKISRQAR